MLMILSVVAGLVIMELALASIVRNLNTGGLLGNPFRFPASGAPLVAWVEGSGAAGEQYRTAMKGVPLLRSACR